MPPEMKATIERVMKAEGITIPVMPVTGRYANVGDPDNLMAPAAAYNQREGRFEVAVDQTWPPGELEFVMYHEIGHYREGELFAAPFNSPGEKGFNHLQAIYRQFDLPDPTYGPEMFAQAYAAVRTGNTGDFTRTGEEMYPQLKEFINEMWPQ